MEGELQSALKCLRCVKCGREYEGDRLWMLCESCGGILDPQYDLERAAASNLRRPQSRAAHGLWRWIPFLPLTDSSAIVSAGEGDTPLIRAEGIGRELGLSRLYVKDEGRNPTGCFKDRGAVVTASKLHQHGVREAVIASEGNASCSLALYAGMAGFKCHAYVPSLISTAKKRLLEALGADVRVVEGNLADAGRVAGSEAAKQSLYNASTFVTPYRHDGKGTMAWELLESFDWQSPDVVVYPVGGGVGLVGMWKMFKYAHELGWAEKTPRMIGVQPEGCAPVVNAFRDQKEDVEAPSQPKTIATGLLVPKPIAGSLILKAIRESGGTAVAVTEAGIRESMRDVARMEGLLLEPSSAAAFAALSKLRDEGAISQSDVVVVIATGSGLKTLEAFA